MERDQLAIDRLSRIWAIIEYIAEHPGTSRRKLAEKYALSERQVQEDLRVIREELRFPLIRRKGYRFSADDGPRRGGLLLLRGSGPHQRPSRSREGQGHSPGAAPVPHVQTPDRVPPAAAAIHPEEPRLARSPEPDLEEKVFLALTEALFEQRPVRLHMGPRGISGMQNPVIEPHLLMPYMGTWYLVGRCRQKKRVMMFKVDSIDAVTLASKI